jgi:type 1 fimbria pilin
MKNSFVFTIVIVLLLVVSGCAAPKQEIEILGNVKTVGNNISVNGTSTLEGGSEIKVELEKLGTNTILNENAVKVDEDGNYSLNFSRENREEDQKLVVSFHPEEQPEEIQKIYGANGENISENSPGLFQYSIDGDEYTGVQMFDFIFRVVKGETGQRTFLNEYFDNPNETINGEE